MSEVVMFRQERSVRSPVRLTRRGRVVVFAVSLALILGFSLLLGSAVTATDEVGSPVATQIITVQPGETLWDIAARVHEGGDIRDTVDIIMELNALDNPAGLQMGRELAVPLGE